MLWIPEVQAVHDRYAASTYAGHIGQSLGHDKGGSFYGGVRKDKGGFQIPLGIFAKCSDKELLWILIKKTIDELFYQKIGIESSSSLDSDT